MFILIILIILAIAIVMSIVILLQSGKGGGLSGIAGGQTTQILGARQAPDLLEKLTWGLGSAFLFLSVMASFFTGTSNERSILQEGAEGIEAPIGLPGAEEGGTELVPGPAGPADEGAAVPSTPGPQPEATPESDDPTE